MLLRRTEKPLSNTLVIWMLLISPLLHACCDNDLRVIGQAWHSSLFSYSFCVTPSLHPLSFCVSATCGASSPLVMILAIRLHFLLLVALWIIFFLSSSPTDMYWKP